MRVDAHRGAVQHHRVDGSRDRHPVADQDFAAQAGYEYAQPADFLCAGIRMGGGAGFLGATSWLLPFAACLRNGRIGSGSGRAEPARPSPARPGPAE